jgi:aspartyl-tRNA synthetase
MTRTLCSALPQAEPGSTVRLQGWVHRRRELAQLTFLVVRDRTGDLQLVCNERTEPASFALLEDVDLGDVVGATGLVGTTRRGELSLFVERLAMLSKSLRRSPRSGTASRTPMSSSGSGTCTSRPISSTDGSSSPVPRP